MLCIKKRTVRVALQNTIDSGGEGVILRQVLSLYEHGRSPVLLKLKVALYISLFVNCYQAARGDQEALVVDVGADPYILQLYAQAGI